MPVFNTKVVPELQFYFGMFVKSTTLNKDEIPFPVQLNREDLYEDRSFIRLLFDDQWPANYTHYFICYHERVCKENWPSIVQTRANIYPTTASYWVACDCTASFSFNIFNLGSEEIAMLDQLLIYRLNPCAYTLEILYSSLTKNLSKLIWHYLNLKINQDYTPYDDIALISDPDNTIENTYETYLIENVFSFTSNKSPGVEQKTFFIYYGNSLATTLTSSSQVVSLSSRIDSSGKSGIYNFDGGGYKYFCYPSNLGPASFVDSETGFEISFEDPYTVSVSGPYTIYRSVNILNSPISIRVS